MGCQITMEFTVQGAKVLVLGTGVTGLAVQRNLQQMGSFVYITDERQKVENTANFLSIAEADKDNFDFVVVSPGWRITHPLVQSLLAKGMILMSEIDLAWKLRTMLHPTQRWIGITGTNGKTTTVELTTAILKAAGLSVTACGNVGDTVIDAVSGSEVFDYLVVELSSFQLEWSREPKYVASAILNIADDHTDWHEGFDNYVQAKLRILIGSEIAILNGDDGVIVSESGSWDGKKVFYTLSSPKPGEVGVVEDLLIDRAFVDDPLEAQVFAELKDVHPKAAHAVSNTLAAAALARAVGTEYSIIQAAIQEFRPGRHRIETVLDKDGIVWINDSKATNPHAAAASIRSFASVIWIAGGLAKGARMAELVSAIAPKLKSAILIGTDRELIAVELARFAPHVPVIRVDGDISNSRALMLDVVRHAKEVASRGDSVLLAPACASMDQFTNYASRGDLFRDAVIELVGSA
jgi:UDP-N-acetylmuramoylalanine--D-glutamate ligase